MRRPMRLVLLAPFAAGAIAIAVAGYTGYWFIAAGRNRGPDRRLGRKTTRPGARDRDRGDAGVRLPLPLRGHSARAANPRHSGTGGAGAAGSLRAEASAWDFSEVTVFPPDRRNSVQVLLKGGEWRDIDAEIDDGRLVVRLDDDRRFREIMLDLQGLEIAGRVARRGAAQIGRPAGERRCHRRRRQRREGPEDVDRRARCRTPERSRRGARRDPRLSRHRRERGSARSRASAGRTEADHRLARAPAARWSFTGLRARWGASRDRNERDNRARRGHAPDRRAGPPTSSATATSSTR